METVIISLPLTNGIKSNDTHTTSLDIFQVFTLSDLNCLRDKDQELFQTLNQLVSKVVTSMSFQLKLQIKDHMIP